MITSFRHRGLEKFYRTGSKAGIKPGHAKRLETVLGIMDAATDLNNMDLAGWDLHPLQPPLRGHWSVKISRMWRVTFTFDGKDCEVVDYQDYH
ncbi:MAG: type II toxin-antitoxin system RelE/ParE family toxin [Acidobacteriota bacterium]|nr:type II toxin-antitoxin system RelE/ParE family toxin [Acidobacteriota bacterium]